MSATIAVAAFSAACQSTSASEIDRADPRGGLCHHCDTNCDTLTDINDIADFVAVLIEESAGCSPCTGDANEDQIVDGRDIQPFIDCLLSPPPPTGACCLAADECVVTIEPDCNGLWLGPETACIPAPCSFGNLTAYRPQHGGGYFPLPRSAVAETDEESPIVGPGIRINFPGDNDPAGEDDLIELIAETTRPDIPLALRRNHSAIRIWTTRNKTPGTEVPFINDKTAALSLDSGSSAGTLWVEWAAAEHGLAELRLEPLDQSLTLDRIQFHTFRSIVMALGGEDQVPSVPVDPNHGTFVVGIALYQRGYDVYLYDEDNVSSTGAGAVYNEIVNAVTTRFVENVSIFGYSHGGGSTYHLSDRLDNDRAGIGIFEIVATSYVDAVRNNSDFDVNQELRRPPATGYHANHYQTGTLADFFLDGGPVPDSNPAPTGLNVETVSWGVGATHFLVDDYVQVRSYIESNFVSRFDP
ncbi:MAG: hypothetical protein KF841_16145 [Phycisphaerae bacterium]|nr:hypothetical protein [Phycisphaerae bacterium]